MNACRARTDETWLLRAKMETQDLPKNQTPHLCRSSEDKNMRQLPDCADRSKSVCLLEAFRFGNDRHISKIREKKAATILSFGITELNRVLHRVKSGIRLCSSLGAKFCRAGIYFCLCTLKQNCLYSKRIHRMICKSRGLSCGLNLSDSCDHDT